MKTIDRPILDAARMNTDIDIDIGIDSLDIAFPHFVWGLSPLDY